MTTVLAIAYMPTTYAINHNTINQLDSFIKDSKSSVVENKTDTDTAISNNSNADINKNKELELSNYNQAVNITNKYIDSDNELNIKLTNITQPINISNALINDTINISFSTFKKEVQINSVSTNNPTNISLNIIKNSLFAQNITAKKAMNLNEILLYGRVIITNLTCKDQCNLMLNKYLKSFRLTHSLFEKTVNMSGSVFYNDALLEKNKYLSSLDISKSIFHKGLMLSKLIINDGISIANSTTNKDINFNNTMIGSYLDMSNVQIENANININSISPLNKNKKIKLYLTNTDLSKTNINYSNFILSFKDSTPFHTALLTYNNMLEKIKQSGDTESYGRLFIEYKQFQYDHNNAYMQNFISKHFWNYSLDKGLPVFWCLVMFAIYCIINAMIFPQLAETYTSDIKLFSNVTLDEQKKFSPIVKFVYFLPFAIILTSVIFIGGFLRMGVSAANFHGKNFFILVYLLLISITGFATILAVISFVF